MLQILNYYPWTRLAVRIIGAIKRQFFLMVTHVFDDSNLSQETFAIDTWRAVIYSLGHGRKHMLACNPSNYMEARLYIEIRLKTSVAVCCNSFHQYNDLTQS